MTDSAPAAAGDILTGFNVHKIGVRERPSMPGADRATLVHHSRPLPDASSAVLFLPGFSDYFFQSEHANVWRDAGVEFYALDMRAQGRNIIAPGSTALPEYVPDMRIRHEDISCAMRILRERHSHVTLLGHSTGGLQAVLYAVDARAASFRVPGVGPEIIPDALVLNSPWLDLNENMLARTVGTRALETLALVAPRAVVAKLDPAYTRDLIAAENGRWNIDPSMKPLDGFAMRAGTFASVRHGHRRVSRGLGIERPILLCHSARSGSNSNPTPIELASTDVVLDVEDMKRLAPRLGDNVQLQPIEGGKHDLACSAPEARAAYEVAAISWVLDR